MRDRAVFVRSRIISMINDILTVNLYFFAYSVMHSFMSSHNWKRRVRRVAGTWFAFYRLVFNITQTLMLILMLMVMPRPSLELWRVEDSHRLLFRFIQAGGTLGLIIAARHFNVQEFLGINQVRRFFRAQWKTEETDEQYQLSDTGLFRFVRHPIYFFSLIIVAFEPQMTLFKALILMWMMIYFYIGSFFEEKRLIRETNGAYKSYQQQVSRLLPWKWFKLKFDKITGKMD
ncbi:MAG: hypothetical protein GF313_02630 [Caldithrix sp.]|nr:hypothetical protein [Caldithrix sp.]